MRHVVLWLICLTQAWIHHSFIFSPSASRCSCLQGLTGPALAQQQQPEGQAEPLLLQRDSSLLEDFAEQGTARQGWVLHWRSFIRQGPMGWTPC